MNSKANEKICQVELKAQLTMIEMGVTKRNAYVWMLYDLTHKPPSKKRGWYVQKSNKELTSEEKETIEICEDLLKREEENVESLEDEDNDYENSLDSTRKKGCYIVCRKDLGYAIWVLNIIE